MMARLAQTTARTRLLGWKSLTLIGAAAIIVLLAAANAHLVYVALASQPDCVPHLKNAGERGTFRAARSSC